MAVQNVEVTPPLPHIPEKVPPEPKFSMLYSAPSFNPPYRKAFYFVRFGQTWPPDRDKLDVVATFQPVRQALKRPWTEMS